MKKNFLFQKIMRALLVIAILGSFLAIPTQPRRVLAKPPSAAFTTCAAQTQIPATECDALVTLYNTTDGPNWYSHPGWLQTDTPCSWYGVSCANATNVTGLALFGRQLYGPLPPELGNLTQLQSLDLGHNYLTGPIPTQLGNLKQLTNLELELNPLGGSIPAQLGNLTKLETLNLHDDGLIGPIPSQLGNLVNLTNLRLESNHHLSGAIPAQFGNLTKLESLNLSENALTGPIPAEFANLTGLGWLNLSRNQLSGPIPAGLAGLTNLNGLFLNGNSLSGRLPAQLGNLTQLTTLYLDGNPLTGEIPASFTRLTALTDLTLACGLTSSNPAVIAFIEARLPGWQSRLCLPVAALVSIADQDGWIIESSETGGVGGARNNTAATFNLGDNQARRQYLGLLSFASGAALPDAAVITKVTLKVKKQGVTGGGDPLATFGGFMVDIKNGFFGSTSVLQIADFQAAAGKTFGPFAPAPVSNWYTLDLTGAKSYVNKLTANSGLTQIRLRFKLDDNNDALVNILSLFSGSAPAVSRPQLIVQYYVP